MAHRASRRDSLVILDEGVEHALHRLSGKVNLSVVELKRERMLGLERAGLSDEDMEALALVLKHNRELSTLWLSGNSISNAGALTLARTVNAHKLTELVLSANELEDLSGLSIAEALKDNAQMRTLYLSHNELTDKSAVALANAIVSNPKCVLSTLSLSTNRVSDDGLSALADALAKNTTLTRLELAHNPYTDAGATALGGALQANSTLVKLDISGARPKHGKIGEKGGKALAAGLRANKGLQYVWMRNHALGDGVVPAFVQVAENSSPLVELSLRYAARPRRGWARESHRAPRRVSLGGSPRLALRTRPPAGPCARRGNPISKGAHEKLHVAWSKGGRSRYDLHL